MDGVQCDCYGCKVKDFLPFSCDKCHKTFCLEHRSVFAHSCEEIPPSRETGNTSHLKPVREMFDEVSQRFVGEEQYSPKEHIAVQSSQVREDSGVTSVAQKINHLDAVAEHSNAKQKSISSSTRNMLMKTRAEGPSNVLAENRHYLAITFTTTKQLRYMYFSKHMTIGECLQYIAAHMSLLAFNSNEPPSTLSLTCTSPTMPWQACNHNHAISTIDCYSDVEVICMTRSEIVAAQRRLQENQATAAATVSTEEHKVDQDDIPQYKVKDTVVYTSSAGEKQLATIVAIHRDDIVPYYTINLSATKQDRQTDHHHLKPYSLHSDTSSARNDFIKVSIKKQVVHVAPVCFSESVLTLKKAIESQTLIPVRQQKLIYKGKVLKDSQTLTSAGIKSGITLTLMSSTVA